MKVTSLSEGHKCYGCGKTVEDYEPHIHFGMDEFSAKMGLEGSFGLDDLLNFVYCSDCMEKVDDGFIPEQHKIVI